MNDDKEECSTRPANVHQSIELMTELLAKIGIEKSKGGTREINYNFRGIDDIRNVIAPLQKKCALNIIPRMIERVENDARTTKNGGFSLWVVVKMEFDFINTIDGSIITCPMQGEAVDYSDKATQKAISQAYKIACINVFNIPTEGEQDADGEVIQIKGKQSGVFESDQLRNLFVENCKGAFVKTESLASLKDIESFYHDKLVMMRNSSVVEDVTAGNDIAALYKLKFEEFSKAKAKL
jgi:hypothetical protein